MQMIFRYGTQSYIGKVLCYHINLDTVNILHYNKYNRRYNIESYMNLTIDRSTLGSNNYKVCCTTDIKCFLADMKAFKENALDILLMIRIGHNDTNSYLSCIPKSIFDLILYQYLFAGPKIQN